ncbi:9441_t:CDS:2 [Paraglomus occultum]|uniref:9441_t:CDS:1 n=1 Tax=Paraglomus occultum TaxID=144539 RepID=A0A9N8ZX17_9GLOM|nr:9441_t:CDS:2 [Paraglomus occultum]
MPPAIISADPQERDETKTEMDAGEPLNNVQKDGVTLCGTELTTRLLQRTNVTRLTNYITYTDQSGVVFLLTFLVVLPELSETTGILAKDAFARRCPSDDC